MSHSKPTIINIKQKPETYHFIFSQETSTSALRSQPLTIGRGVNDLIENPRVGALDAPVRFYLRPPSILLFAHTVPFAF